MGVTPLIELGVRTYLSIVIAFVEFGVRAYLTIVTAIIEFCLWAYLTIVIAFVEFGVRAYLTIGMALIVDFCFMPFMLKGYSIQTTLVDVIFSTSIIKGLDFLYFSIKTLGLCIEIDQIHKFLSICDRVMAWIGNRFVDIVEIFNCGEFLICEAKASSITRSMRTCS